VEWNSAKTTINATQLLIKLYEEEDARFHVTYDTGILKDKDRPLNPRESYLIKKYGLEQVQHNEKTGGNLGQPSHTQMYVFEGNQSKEQREDADKMS